MSDVIGNNNVIHNGKNGYVCNTLEDYIVAIKERNPMLAEQAHKEIVNPSTHQNNFNRFKIYSSKNQQ